MSMQINPSAKREIDHWLRSAIDPNTKKAIETLVQQDPQKAEDLFSHKLAFGTGGVRAKMGVGPSLLNVYTIEMLTQALCNYIQMQPATRPTKRCMICYDTRKHSKEFAEIAARVCAGNQIEAYICKNPRPTPFLSFAIPHFHCQSGIMITASHNPPVYNGYKVYWDKGEQVIPPHDVKIIEEVDKITHFDQVKLASEKDPLIHWIGKDFDKIYLEAIHTLQPVQEKKKSVKIIYTPLHGTGYPLAEKALKMWGFSHLSLVQKQLTTDGTFSTVKKPNPEEEAALQLGANLLMEEKADILLATDPDADRVGCVVREKEKAYRLTGNQVACLLLYYLLEENKDLPDNSACIKSIVTTELFAHICYGYDIHCENVLTGFKYIAGKIDEWEKSKEYNYLFGAEESCGYLYKNLARDKDAILASCLIAECAQFAKKRKKTLYTLLIDLYERFGLFRESLKSIEMEDLSSAKNIMHSLRDTPITSFCGIKVVTIEDYKEQKATNLITKEKLPLSLPQSDVLLYWLEDQSKIVIRPSGTEPKVKCYAGVHKKAFFAFEKEKKALDQKLEDLLAEASSHFK